jgi:hypothetical protein
LTIARDIGGPATELVPASCGGAVIASDPTAGTIVVACEKLGMPAPLVEYGGKRPRAIGASTKSSGDNRANTIGRYLLGAVGDRWVTIDLRTGTTRVSADIQGGVASFGDRSLVVRGEQLVLIEPTSERALGKVVKFPHTLQEGRFVWVDPYVIDLATGAVIGETPIRPAGHGNWPARGLVSAIALDGRLLVGFDPNGSAGTYVSGPLEWLSPTRTP